MHQPVAAAVGRSGAVMVGCYQGFVLAALAFFYHRDWTGARGDLMGLKVLAHNATVTTESTATLLS